jgi:ABC-type glycerol-3-phosphate transport system substrate-binding protein
MMRIRRRRPAIFVAVAALIGGLAMAVSPSAMGAPTKASSLSGQSITVVLEGGDPSTTAIQTLLPQFEHATGVHVTIDSIPYSSLTSDVLLEFSRHSSTPDVVMDDWVYGSEFAASKYIVPINSVAKSNTQFGNLGIYYPAYLKTMTENGQVYGVPVYGETTLLSYRKDLFAKYGISGPPTTMQQLSADAALILSKSKGKIYGITMRGEPGIQSVYIYAGFLRSYGGNWFTKNGTVNVGSPQAIAAAKEFVSLLRSNGPPAVDTYGWADNRIEFDQGHAGVTIDASANGPYDQSKQYSTIVGRVGYAAVPYARGVVPSGQNTNHSLEVHGMFLSAFSQHQAAAYAFMSWATSVSVQEKELKIAPQPGLTATSVFDSPAYAKLYSSFKAEMLKELATGNPEYLPTGPLANLIITDVGQELNTALAGQVTPAAAMATAEANILSSE